MTNESGLLHPSCEPGRGLWLKGTDESWGFRVWVYRCLIFILRRTNSLKFRIFSSSILQITWGSLKKTKLTDKENSRISKQIAELIGVINPVISQASQSPRKDIIKTLLLPFVPWVEEQVGDADGDAILSYKSFHLWNSLGQNTAWHPSMIDTLWSINL